MADTQVDMARVAEQHVQETSRTARQLADEVARVTSQETEQHLRNQQEALRNFRDPFQHATQHEDQPQVRVQAGKAESRVNAGKAN